MVDIERVKKSLDANIFSTEDWGEIKYEEISGAPCLTIKREGVDSLCIYGATLDDVCLIKHLIQDMYFLINAISQLDQSGKCKELISSNDFQLIRKRDEFATPSRWSYTLEGRDHFGGDSMIWSDNKKGVQANIYLHPLTNEQQDFIAQARNDLTDLIELVIEKCGTKYMHDRKLRE